MCGIAGVLGQSDGARASATTVDEMCRAIAHRGPDGGGVKSHDEATLGMRRLAIVDVSHGHQPMETDDGSIVLVFNGEIYNAPELRARLQSLGVRFKTRSDTEVILRLYERDPDDVEAHLAGMWAFAIHDRRRRRVVLSRDRFGIKPLFIADTGGAAAFASELRCFRGVSVLPAFSPLFSLSGEAAHAMLSWGYVPELDTIYSGVKRLAPGHRLEINLVTHARRTLRYWSLRPSSEAARVTTLDEACELIEPLLSRAVKEHLESDVPIATFLSGGIDSSLISAHAVAASTNTILAYSIGFQDPRFDESPHARAVAAKLGMRLEVDRLDESTARESLADALLAYDEPFGDSSSLATFMLASRVGRSHKVALAGDGGDEVFAGYKKHRIIGVRDAIGRAPVVRDAIAAALSAIPSRTDRTRRWTEALRTVRRVARGLQGRDAEAYVALTQVASLAKTAELVRDKGHAERFAELARARFEQTVGSQLQRTLTSDLTNPLPNDMLTKVDRASMACHLEVRVPFLDHRLVEAGLGLPQQFTLGRSGKEVLRTLYARRFGDRLARRKKQGFGVPVERWLATSLRGACDELFATKRLDRSGLLSSEALGDGRWRTWLETDPQLLWHALALSAWCVASQDEGPDALRDILRASPRPSTTPLAPSATFAPPRTSTVEPG